MTTVEKGKATSVFFEEHEAFFSILIVRKRVDRPAK